MVRRFSQAVACCVLSAWMCAQTISPVIHPLSMQKIRFEGITVLSLQEQKAIAEKAWQRFSAGPDLTPDSYTEILRMVVLQAYQQKGYWKAQVTAEWENANDPSEAWLVRAMEEGPAYVLKDVRWSGATVFPEEELRQQLAMQSGDILDRARILAGMVSVQKLYQTRGYKDYTATPELEFEEGTHAAILHIGIEEDGLLRFRNLAVLGLERPHAEKLERQWAQLRGEPYSQEKLRSFLQKVLHTRPGQDPLDYSASDVDLDAHSVDVRITFMPKAAQAEATTPR